MVRTDLAFERNRERIRFYHRRPARVGGLIVFVLLVLGVAGGYIFRDKVEVLIRRVAPSLQSRGRAAMGKISMLPLNVVIDQSDLAPADKTAWKEFVDTTWNIAEESDDVVYRRRDVIDLSRRAVDSIPGLFYALKEVELKGVDGLGLDEEAQAATREAVQVVRDELASGRIGYSQLASIKELVPAVLIDLRLGTVEEHDKADAINARRALLQGLKRIRESPDRLGNGIPLKMGRELERVLDVFKTEMEKQKMSVGLSS